jgi:hypothetical protein
MYYFPDQTSDSEAIFIFIPNSQRVSVASNYEYEVWNNGDFLGMGGRRCPLGEAYLNHWIGDHLQFRLHWINIKTSRVWHRCLFKDPFLYCNDSTIQFKCYRELSCEFCEKFSSQLPRQNILKEYNLQELKLNILTYDWNIIEDPVKLMNHILIQPKLVSSGTLSGKQQSFNDVLLSTKKQQHVDIVDYIRTSRLKYETYDLGLLALHKFILPQGIYYYTQTKNFKKEWKNSNQAKVKIADAILSKKSSPIGYRGCRYLHVFSCTEFLDFKIYRAQYPLDFKSTHDSVLINAVKNTMIACIDGGFVDTCWRERAQWTGDARMMAKAVRSLTNNHELIPFVFHQISKSYDKDTGMVNCAYPVVKPDYKTTIPGYHLAFCLGVLENNLSELKDLVLESIEFWKKKYLNNGLISNVPGWMFSDWDFNDTLITGRNNEINSSNCIVNAWFLEVCDILKIESGIDMKIFINTFYKDSGYSLYPDDNVSVHATAAVMSSLKGFKEIIHVNVLDLKWKNKITAYFAYFICKSLNDPKEFIEEYYMESALKYSTIWEKHDGSASIAHGWSIAFVEFLV